MAAVPLLNRVPADIVGQQQLPKLQAFTEDLGALLVRDPQTGRVLVHRPSLSSFLASHSPPAAAQGLLARCEQRFSAHLTDHDSFQRVPWEELSRHGAPVHPPSDADLDASGLTHHPQRADVENWLHQHYGQLEGTASHLTRDQLNALVNQVSSASAAQRGMIAGASVAGFEDCLVRHLGWWAMIMIVGVLGALLILFTATGPIGLALTIWCIGVFGGGTAAVIINCALNNSW